MWLKLGTPKQKSLADELRKITKAKQTEEKAEKKKEKAKMRELAKNEAPIMFNYLKQEFIISAKKGKDYWTCNSDYFKKIIVRNGLHSDEDYIYKELEKVCKRNKIGIYVDITYIDLSHKLKTYKFYWY